MSESQLRFAFRSACQDLGAISALLGFEEYPGVDELLRSITELLATPPHPIADAAVAHDERAPTTDAVYAAMSDGAKRRTSRENVADVLATIPFAAPTPTVVDAAVAIPATLKRDVLRLMHLATIGGPSAPNDSGEYNQLVAAIRAALEE